MMSPTGLVVSLSLTGSATPTSLKAGSDAADGSLRGQQPAAALRREGLS
jgi:hypothetical protein